MSRCEFLFKLQYPIALKREEGIIISTGICLIDRLLSANEIVKPLLAIL